MPSAANIKVDKQITSETASVDSASNQQNTPIKQAIVVIEHKIRNLEKRKAKLESYRELQNSGKDLNQDQKVAVAKYDEVVQTLDFARDLCKQFQSIAAVADKEAKKVARKEASARSQQEIAKVREILLVQDALTQLGQDNVREDFLLGRNGAVTLSDSDLKLLDDIYPEVSPKHEPGAPANFTTNVQTAAEHLLAIVDGKAKDAFGSTYSYTKEVIGKIHESGYFDQPTAADSMLLNPDQQHYVEEFQEPIPVEPEIEEVAIAAQVTMEASMPPPEMSMEGPMAPMYHVEPTLIQEEVPVVQAPAAAVLAPIIDPQFYQPPARPITEVLGTGAFFFLQDSELDSPEQAPQNPVMQPNAAIPSQTFTNQNFATMAEATGVPRPNPNMPGFVAPINPPPPIPMPPSHLTGMEFPPQQMANYAAYQQQQQGQQPVPEQMPPQQQPQPHHMHHGPANGGSDDVSSKQPSGDSPKNGAGRPRNNPNQRKNGPSGGPNNYYQSYYPQQQHNNNGYSNRPRPARGGGSGGGPRSGGNRPPTQNHQNKPPKQQAAQQHL